jgi:hypothetical protein
LEIPRIELVGNPEIKVRNSKNKVGNSNNKVGNSKIKAGNSKIRVINWHFKREKITWPQYASYRAIATLLATSLSPI